MRPINEVGFLLPISVGLEHFTHRPFEIFDFPENFRVFQKLGSSGDMYVESVDNSYDCLPKSYIQNEIGFIALT